MQEGLEYWSGWMKPFWLVERVPVVVGEVNEKFRSDFGGKARKGLRLHTEGTEGRA